MGATTILGTSRDRDLLARVQAMAPQRIRTHSTHDGPIDEWVREVTDGGVDVSIDALGPGAPHEPFIQGIRSLRRGGRAVNIGATAGEGQDMAAMAANGMVDPSIFEHVIYPLAKVNDAINGIENRHGGFGNFLVTPNAQ